MIAYLVLLFIKHFHISALIQTLDAPRFPQQSFCH
jgi:hypothetical protein